MIKEIILQFNKIDIKIILRNNLYFINILNLMIVYFNLIILIKIY